MYLFHSFSSVRAGTLHFTFSPNPPTQGRLGITGDLQWGQGELSFGVLVQAFPPYTLCQHYHMSPDSHGQGSLICRGVCKERNSQPDHIPVPNQMVQALISCQVMIGTPTDVSVSLFLKCQGWYPTLYFFCLI